MKTAQHTLTVAETDEIILKHSIKEDGAIEDAEVSPTQVSYFFQSGAIGTVDRVSGRVTMQEAS